MTYKLSKFSFISSATKLTSTGMSSASNQTGLNEAVIEISGGLGGKISGYTSGGYFGPPATYSNVIDKFPFATNANATDVGDLTVGRQGSSGQSSAVSGYTSGGFVPPWSNVVDKFPFATNSNATDVGDLTQSKSETAGQSSTISGYASGGSSFTIPTISTSAIDKFSFATDANSINVGNLISLKNGSAGHSSTVSGYNSGGLIPGSPGYTNVIEKFPFAISVNSVDVGDLTNQKAHAAGQSSTTSGYTSGGYGNNPLVLLTTIEKFPFATDANATNIGDLTQARRYSAGQSSTIFGYTSGGLQVPPSTPGTFSNVIDKFPFATNSSAADVGDLTVSRRMVAGQQY